MEHILFRPRWREELVATSSYGKLIFEMTMGIDHVYFPDETQWLAHVPDWAKDKWPLYCERCREWCVQNGIPFTNTPNALVYEEKEDKQA